MNKYIQSIGVYLLVILVYLIGKDNFLDIFDKTVLPHLSNLNFSVLTHIVFILICITICWRILIIYKRKYRISYISICYIILTLFIYTEHRVRGPYYATPNLFYGIGYMDIIMFLLGVSVLLILYIKYWPQKINQNPKNAENSFILDSPITTEEEDLLDYSSSAHILAEKIKNADTHHSCSIGLIAPWGMGKTSYLNILSRCFDSKSFIILRFNPRHSISSDNIQADFFNLLFSTLGQFDSRFDSSFKDYLKAISVISDNSFINKILNIHKIWDKEVEKGEINDAIKHIDKRIIVFIDDFDRLLRDEIIEVFKLIDGNASFTNLIFISAYDKEYINTIIECDHSQYNSFADKFFTIEVHLPVRPYAATYNYLLDNVSKLLNLSNEDKENYNSIIGPNLDIVQRYLPTIRDVKRFLNLFINRFAMLREEVEFKDYFFLSLIRYRFINEYNNLRDGHYTNIDIKKGFNQLHIKEGTSCQSIDVLNILFSGNLKFRSINNKAAFNIYFYESVVAGLEIKEMKQLFIFTTLDEVYSYIDNAYKKNMFPYLLSYIESVNIVAFNDFASFERYVDIVMYIVANNRGSLFTNVTAFGLIYKRSAEQVCDRYNITEDKYKEMMMNKLRGCYPLYPYQLIRDLVYALLQNEIKEETILNVDEIVTIAKDSLYELCKKDPNISQQHLNMLYNCVSRIDAHTHKAILYDDVCKLIKCKIKANPATYFENFVRLGGISSSPDFNTIACEPFWIQLFGNASDFESYINGLTTKDVPNILCVRNFWELYKNNAYSPIEFENQGNVQDKINNCFRDEIRQLKELLYIKEQIDETGAINDELTKKFENNNLYIKLRGDVFRMINNLKD